MKRRLIITTGLALTLCQVEVVAQDLSREDYRYAEWKMKTEHWRKIQDTRLPGVALDQADFDVKYWELDIDITDIDGQTVTGVVTMTSESTVDGLTEVQYDLHHNMMADSVKMDGQSVVYQHDAEILSITLEGAYDSGEHFTTVVYYHGSPGGSGSFDWDTHDEVPIISTLSEPEGAREWWPCKDQPHDKADSADVIITCPDNMTATSNGIMVSEVDNGDGTRTFHWHISYPITTYLISVAATNYQSFTDWYQPMEGDPMPIVNYVYPERFDNAVEDLSITADAVGFFAGLFGEYPFVNEKYGHSLFPWGGAMEHQCNTSYGAGLIRGDHYYDWILVHELSHQWFGDMITCDIWPDIWMNEGFASYCEALWTENLYGQDAYIDYMRYNNSVNSTSGPIYDPDYLFDSNTVYDKGSWVLHMLRGVMGDEAFFAGMYGYANDPDHQYGTITTRQFQAIMETYYGNALDWFFDEWVWGLDNPHYLYSWMDEDRGGGQFEIFLHIEQTQSRTPPDFFTMPIKVYPTISGEDTLVTVWNDDRIDDIRFLVDGNPSALELDKYFWILREIQLTGYSLNIVTPDLPDGWVDNYYDAVIEARGGQSPYWFEVADGSLPPGLSLDNETGDLTGIPTEEGEYAFTILCTDSSDPQLEDDQNYEIDITSGFPECAYVAGDCNHNGIPLELGDVVTMIGLYRGTSEAPYTCSCPPNGDDFAPEADPSGNCEAFELGDVVTEIVAYRGYGTVSGCPDCPESLRLVPEEEKIIRK